MMTDALTFLSQQYILVGVLLVLVILFIRMESARGGEQISTHQLTTLINRENALVIDVRDAKEFKEGHIVDSTNIPFAKLKDHLSELETHKERPLVVVDKMGQHSGAAGKQLREAGFNASRLEGGITEWKGSNLPTIKE